MSPNNTPGREDIEIMQNTDETRIRLSVAEWTGTKVPPEGWSDSKMYTFTSGTGGEYGLILSPDHGYWLHNLNSDTDNWTFTRIEEDVALDALKHCKAYVHETLYQMVKNRKENGDPITYKGWVFDYDMTTGGIMLRRQEQDDRPDSHELSLWVYVTPFYEQRGGIHVQVNHSGGLLDSDIIKEHVEPAKMLDNYVDYVKQYLDRTWNTKGGDDQ